MKINEMLTELANRGISDYKIASAISTFDKNISASIINRLRRGVHTKTSYERGRLISEFYQETINQGTEK